MGDEIYWPKVPPCYGFPFGYARGNCRLCENRESCRVAAEAMAADLECELRQLALLDEIREV